jgi:hypothetical protein
MESSSFHSNAKSNCRHEDGRLIVGFSEKGRGMKLKCLVVALASLLATMSAYAGGATGTVGQVMVGRLGNQVFIELHADQYSGWPCSATHSSGFRYAFLLGSDKAKAMLSIILTAQATGQQLQVVGSGNCGVDASLEDVDYVVLRP